MSQSKALVIGVIALVSERDLDSEHRAFRLIWFGTD